MNKNIIIAIAVVILIVTPAFWLAVEKSPNLNTDMAKLAKIVKGYLPVVMNNSKPLTVNQVLQLEKDMDKMIDIFQSNSGHFSERSEGMRITQKAMFDLVARTRKQLKDFKSEAVKGHLKGVAQLCIGCHGQDQIASNFFKGFDETKFQNNFEFAEYNFITRKYRQAQKYYELFLSKSQMQPTQEVVASLNKLLVIHVLIYDVPDPAIDYFTKITKNLGIDPLLKLKLQNWIAELEDWKKRDDFQNISKFVDVQRFVALYLDPIEAKTKSNLEGKSDVTYLRLWGLLNNYMSSFAKDYEYPFLYYWLALTDEALNHSTYFSLSAFYLAECFSNFAGHPMAGKCRDKYEKLIEKYLN